MSIHIGGRGPGHLSRGQTGGGAATPALLVATYTASSNYAAFTGLDSNGAGVSELYAFGS